MRLLPLLPAAIGLVLLLAPGSAGGAAPPPPADGANAQYVPGKVLVRYREGTAAAERARLQRSTGTKSRSAVPGGAQALSIQNGASVPKTLSELRSDPHVAYAVPDYVAHAAALVPNDPGFRLQWNFRPPFGLDMPDAWTIARRLHAPGGRGAVVAVLDTGVAYRNFGRRYRRAPDLARFVRGYDFVSGDRYPFDLNGHGTHVAGTIAETTNNRRAAAGIAYRAKIMPVRVLDAVGVGDTVAIARGIRWAARHHADVINLSLEFDSSVRASEIPDVVSALRYARHRGAVVVAAAGNEADAVVTYPGRVASVISVGATTARGCQAEYSNGGVGLDVMAPGGGPDAPNADNAWDASHCRPDLPGRNIFQETFTSSIRRFGLPRGYQGSSMAAPHVAGVAAMLIASHRLGRHPSPIAVEQRIEESARDIGPPGYDGRYGYGLVDPVAALRP
jgi:serine protease